MRHLTVGSALLMAGFAALTAQAPAALAQTYTANATTQGEAAVAGVLDTIQNPATGPYTAVTAAIDALPNQAARANALGQLSPRNYRVMPRLSIQAMDSADREIRGYLAQRREMALDASSGVPTSGDRTMTFMASYGLKQGKYDARPDRPSANFDSRSIRAGIDMSPIPGLIVGASVGIDGIDANLARLIHETAAPRFCGLGSLLAA